MSLAATAWLGRGASAGTSNASQEPAVDDKRTAEQIRLEIRRELSKVQAANIQAPRTAPTDPLTEPTKAKVLDEFVERDAHARQWKEHQTRLEMHRQEPRDAVWAAEMERSIGAELEAAASQRTFENLRVDCRSVSCVASIQWPSVEAARSEFYMIKADMRDVPCYQRATLPDTDDQSGSVDLDIYVDCTGYLHGEPEDSEGG